MPFASLQMNNMSIIPCGTFNAVVVGWQRSDNAMSVGPFQIGTRNKGGKCFVQWASCERLVLANTRSRNPFDKQ